MIEASELPTQPMSLFNQWLQDAIIHGAQEPYAMTVATSDAAGMPHARVVYLREVVEEGFVFYTNYRSNKSQQIEQNPKVALNMHWPERDRQVRVNGLAERAPEALSDAYFAGRARESQLGAWASPQSAVITDRQWLMDELEKVRARFKDREIPRPPHWGGFLIRPSRIEFWEGHSARLHNRFVYEYDTAGQWNITRLAP